VDFDGCASLAVAIQQDGHRATHVKDKATTLGLEPRWLPRQRSW
jgi:hypothetical protein